MHKFPYKVWVVAGLLLLMPWVAHAVGLGKLNILSSLEQPLLAEVDLVSVDKDELSSLTARLASPAAYNAANVQYSPALMGVRLSIEKRADGAPYIKITSTDAINEPFIDFLIELNWAQGKLMRQYTALIGPPGFASPNVAAPPGAVASPTATSTKPIEAAPAPAAAPTEAAPAKPEENKTEQPSAAETQPEETKPAEETQPEMVSPMTAESATKRADYAVKRGDTLYKIAVSIKPEGLTIEQLLVALYRNNPEAFVGNMNRLKAGKILRIPDEEQVAAITQSEAVKEIRVQAASWNAYRNALAAAATPAQEEVSAASGKITTTVEAQTAAQKTPQEVLKLSKGGTTIGTKSESLSPKERINALGREATARELAEANDRVTQLEKQINDMQHLLELKGIQVPSAPDAQQTEPAQGTIPAPPTPQQLIVEAPPSPGFVDQILGKPLYLVAAGGALVLLGGAGYLVLRRRPSTGKTFSLDRTMAMQLGTPEKKAAGLDLEAGDKAVPLTPDFEPDFGDVATVPPPDLKIDDINLSFDDVPNGKSPGSGKDERWFGVQTKFDLAKAYQEMEDKDSARAILQEVVKEGDAAQQEEARKRLESLS